jgi:hypothetical protein
MTRTILAMVIITAGILLWDLCLGLNRKDGDTISEVVRRYSHQYPLIPFVIGFLIGHWWG